MFQHAAALISGVTAVWPTQKEPDAEHLYSSGQETFKYGYHSVSLLLTDRRLILMFTYLKLNYTKLIHIFIMTLDQITLCIMKGVALSDTPTVLQYCSSSQL